MGPATLIRVIETEADLAAGAAALAKIDPRLAPAIGRLSPLPLRRREAGFATLLWIITGQLISTAAAEAVWTRLRAAGLDDAARVAACDPQDLLAAGLSRAKARYAQDIALIGFDFRALQDMTDTAALTALRRLPGVGPWTAELYLLSAMGRADVFPHADLALQEAARRLLDLPARPDARAMAGLASAWAPWRAVAARLLWAYYRQQ